MKRKLIALLMSVITMISICTSAVPAFAITYQLNDKNKTNIGKLVFGYDTDWYNEDYAWSMGTECNTKAAIRRMNVDTHFYYGSEKAKNKYSKYEVRHNGDYVFYAIVWSCTYGDTTSSSSPSSVKG